MKITLRIFKFLFLLPVNAVIAINSQFAKRNRNAIQKAKITDDKRCYVNLFLVENSDKIVMHSFVI